jgi:hypothetical protein
MNLATCGLYTVFAGMKQRCYDKNASNYPRYGGRGITICAEWLANPPAFYAWALAHGYRSGMQIDRIDPDLGYAPGNCQIITARENAARRRSPRKCA